MWKTTGVEEEDGGARLGAHRRAVPALAMGNVGEAEGRWLGLGEAGGGIIWIRGGMAEQEVDRSGGSNGIGCSAWEGDTAVGSRSKGHKATDVFFQENWAAEN